MLPKAESRAKGMPRIIHSTKVKRLPTICASVSLMTRCAPAPVSEPTAVSRMLTGRDKASARLTRALCSVAAIA